MSKHTPGPWKLWHCGYTSAPYVVYAKDKPGLNENGDLEVSGGLIAEAPTTEGPQRDEFEANARLIASAPELHGLLCRVLDVRSRLTGNAAAQAWDKLTRDIESAIAKAEGAK